MLRPKNMSVLPSPSPSVSHHPLISHQALIRDGYRCVVTGKYDTRSVKMIRELKEMVDLDPSARRESTQCAHIFSESTNSSIEPGSAKVRPIFTFNS